MISPVQSRMARAALGWGVRDLAAAAKVGISTVNRFETEQASAIPATVGAMRAALEAAGVEFIGSDGVRLRGPLPTAARVVSERGECRVIITAADGVEHAIGRFRNRAEAQGLVDDGPEAWADQLEAP